MLSKSHMTEWVGSFNCKLPICQVWWPYILQKCRYKFFSFVTWPFNQKFIWLWKWGPPTKSYYPAKFVGHRYCRSTDKVFTIVTWLPDQKVTWLRMWGLPTVSYHPAKSDGYRYCRRADTSFLNLPHDHIIKRLHDFEGGFPPPQVTTLLSLMPKSIAEEQI